MKRVSSLELAFVGIRGAVIDGEFQLFPFTNNRENDLRWIAEPRKRWPWVLLWSVLSAVGVAVAVFVVSFLIFANHISSFTSSPNVSADGIVVLTGGRARVTGALELLERKRAKRLLISGVHPATTARQIVRRTESRQALFACCVDLDRRAQDTSGNAAESNKWAARHGFTSLIVVTSAYHMPRSILELRAAMPDMAFVPYPVIGADLDLQRWYVKPRTSRLLLREYVKYILAWLRISMEPAPAPQTTASATVVQSGSR